MRFFDKKSSTSWRPLLLTFIAVELLSLTAYFFPWLNAAGFILLAALALILSIQKLEYGLYFVLAELILGGKGYLFSFDLGGTAISLRMGLFVVVMAVWLAKMLLSRRPTTSSPPLSIGGNIIKEFPLPLWERIKVRGDIYLGWWLLGVAIVWGLITGLLRGNDFSNLFLDANGYFYAAMILPFLWVFSHSTTPTCHSHENGNPENVPNINNAGFRIKCGMTVVFLTATTWLAVKTLLTVYFLTHVNNIFFAANLESFYRWMRDTGVGEITWLPGNFARVFFQSHIYNIAAFFFLLLYIVQKQFHAKRDDRHVLREILCPTILLAFNLAVIIIGLSRSFWVGVMTGLVIVFILLLINNTAATFRLRRLKPAATVLFTLFIAFILACVLLIIVARFPFPMPSALDLSAATKSRLELASEAAASSRWNLLPPLWQAIKKHLVLGNGFGATVTYISNDPRVREQNPSGEYTTYAFEWGWLDLWLKFGILGLAAYLLLLYQLARRFWQTKNEALSLAGLAIIFSLTTIHFFTPYLNHPLGFGLLIILTIVSLKHSPETSDSPAEIPVRS